MEHMEREIGEAAGKIWNALNAKGVMSKARLAKVTGLPTARVDQGIGWLAREGKLVREKGKKGEVVSLKE